MEHVRFAEIHGAVCRVGSLGIALAMVLGGVSRPALAAGDPRWGGLPPGQTGAAGPQLTPVQQRITELKLSLAKDIQQGVAPSQSLYDELGQLTKVAIHDRYGMSAAQGAKTVAPLYQQGNWYYASVDGNTTPWTEPAGDPANEAPPDSNPTYTGSQFFPNMCGPGSAVKLLSNWIPNLNNSSTNHAGTYGSNYGTNFGGGQTNSGAQGLMLLLALQNNYDPNGWGMMDTSDPNFPGYWNTAPGKEASVVNGFADITWYAPNNNSPSDSYGDTAGGESTSNLTSHLSVDTQTYGYSMAIQVNAANLADGWSSRRVEHLVQVNGYDPTDNMIRFFDSANPNEDGAGISPGFHNISITNVTNNSGLYDDIW